MCVGLAAAKEVSVDAAVAPFPSHLDGVFTLKEQRAALKALFNISTSRKPRVVATWLNWQDKNRQRFLLNRPPLSIDSLPNG